LKAAPDEGRLWQFILILPNVGYMGFPVTQAVFGDEGMVFAAMTHVAFSILCYTWGVHLLTKGTGRNTSVLRNIANNPPLIAVIIGIICALAGFRLPWPVANGLDMLAGLTSPLSMIVIGSVLAKSRLADLFSDWRMVPLMAARLLVIPLLVFAVLRNFLHNPTMLGVIVVLSAMPAAAVTAILSEHYGGNTKIATKLVALSTILCVATIPLMALMLEYF
jgi:hypothetical protein